MAPPAHLVDLSWPVHPGMAMFPGDPPMELRPMGSYEPDGFLSHLASLPAHSGTHVDAPGHVLPGAPMLAELPLSRFAGPGVALDLRGRPGLAVTEADLAPHLELLLALAPAFVLLHTGDEARWGQADYYSAGAHLTPSAARLLAGLAGRAGIGPETGPSIETSIETSAEAGLPGIASDTRPRPSDLLSGVRPGLSGIGMDAGSADPAGSHELPAHRALLEAGLVIVENLRGLGQLPRQGFDFFCLPLLGLDGSPVRAAALVPGAAGPGARP
ncbi:cyclase family protein [Humidesulfovibrio sp.]